MSRTRKKTPQARTTIAKAKFLASFCAHGIVVRAARDAGIGRRQVYRWCENDTRFAECFTEAEQDGVDSLEVEARRRAVEGWDEPVYQKGAKVGIVRKFSDALLITMLKAKKPEYRDKFDINATMTVSASEASTILAEGRRRAALEAAREGSI